MMRLLLFAAAAFLLVTSTYAEWEEAVTEVERENAPASTREDDPELCGKLFRPGIGYGGNGQVKVPNQKTKLACLLACFNKRQNEDSTINGVDYGVSRKTGRQCYCNKGSTSVRKSIYHWVTSLFPKELVNAHFQDGYGKGGKGQVKISNQKTKFACLLACFNKQQNEDSTINGVDYGVKSKKCYCNRGSTGVGKSSSWVTSLLTPGAALPAGPLPAGCCHNSNWRNSIKKAGWNLCDKTDQYVRGFYRMNTSRKVKYSWGGDLFLLREARCCSKNSQFSERTCKISNWKTFGTRRMIWNKCANGYFIQGIWKSRFNVVGSLKKAKCCRPKNAKSTWGDCYRQNIRKSFDKQGWSECKKDYFLAGLYKGDCNRLHCIEYMYCCRMDYAGLTKN